MTAGTKDKKQALDTARVLCSRREMSVREVLKKLVRYELTEDDQQEIIATLIQEKFIDERRLANAYANDKTKLAGWGPAKVRQGLMLKGIPAPIVSEVMAGLAQNENSDKLVEIATRKLKSIRGETSYDKRNKLIRFLLSRGFNFDDCLRVAEKLLP